LKEKNSTKEGETFMEQAVKKVKKPYTRKKLPENLLALLHEGKTVVVLATFNDQGEPHQMPLSCIYPAGKEGFLTAIQPEHMSYNNLVWQKKVSLCFLAEGNIAYTILGRAGVVRAPSKTHPLMNIVRIDLIDFKSNVNVLQTVESRVTTRPTSAEADDLLSALLQELKELASEL
jgi:hypothetical protein